MPKILRVALPFVLLLLGGCQTSRSARLWRSPSSTFATDGAFLLGAGDVLEIKGYLPNDEGTVATVGPDGRIDLPLIGTLPAAGMTTADLARKVGDAYRPFVKNARFTVAIREQRSYRVYVMGEVKQPGQLNFMARTTLAEAIAKAGGRTDFAGSSVRLYRRGSAGRTYAEASWSELLDDQTSGEPIYAERDDLIVVE